jgi:enoyl-[acyl-carrier protein] reductase I
MTSEPIQMTDQRTLDWTASEEFPVGKGATVQEFVALAGGSRYIIDVAPWGGGRFMVDGREIAHVDGAKDTCKTFDDLSGLAERYLRGEPIEFAAPRRSPLIPAAKAKLLSGKRGPIVGIANENSIAWLRPGVPGARDGDRGDLPQ